MLIVEEVDALVLRGARIIDPAEGVDRRGDIAVDRGVLVVEPPAGAVELDASAWIVCPGLLDIHVHLREPGQSHKETIETGTGAATAGGFTFVACMPNTNPPLDDPATLAFVLREARRVGHCAVGPVAAITRGRHGRQLCDFPALRDAGAVAFSDDGTGVEDDAVMLDAFRTASELDVLLIQHCEYRSLSAGGVMHLGEISRRLSVPGLDPRSEEAMIERDIDLCRRTGGRYHVAHISTALAVDLVRRARAEGLPVTAEVCTHHLMLTHEACGDLDPNTKMHPPLRTQEDVDACRRGLLDGTIDCVVSDHAPHTVEEKSAGFLAAPPGIVGLETALGVTAAAMIDTGLADWASVLRWFTCGPAGVLKRPVPRLSPGLPADLTMIHPTCRWTVEPQHFVSLGRNTPFGGWTLPSKAIGTLRGRVFRRLAETGGENPSLR